MMQKNISQNVISILFTVTLFLFAFLPFNTLKFIFDFLARDGIFSFLSTETVVIFRVLFVTLALISFAAFGGFAHWVKLYALLIAVLYGVIASAQILGFFQIYWKWLAVSFALCIAIAVFWAYTKFRSNNDFYNLVLSRQSNTSSLDKVLWMSGIFLMLMLILVPLIIWPYSPINPVLNWDAGLYHFPKALELANTGSAWDMTIHFGEYPYGYESLFAFAVLMTHDGTLFGSMHALGVLFFILTFWLLLCRYTRLPPGFLFFLTVFVMISGAIWKTQNNPWWIYRVLLYDTIGKNDLFLGAGLLAVILHSPVGTTRNQYAWNLPGMAFVTMIALSVKPNALLVIGLLWGIVIVFHWRKNTAKIVIQDLLLSAFVIFPGLFWVLRNLIANGSVFSKESLGLQKQSILNNLFDPRISQNITFIMFFVLAALLFSLFWVVRKKQMTWRMYMVLLALFASFIATPASGFIRPALTNVYFSWRFAAALLAFCFIVLIVGLEPWLDGSFYWISSRLIVSRLLSIGVIGITLLLIWGHRWDFLPTTSNATVLVDQYRDTVGVNGYHSAFDYIRKNAHNSIVWVDNGLPFYAYGPGFSNSTTRLKKPDYYVVLQTNWEKKGAVVGYSPELETSAWKKEWLLVYEDGDGRVYRHR